MPRGESGLAVGRARPEGSRTVWELGLQIKQPLTSYGCVCHLGVHFLGVFVIRALIFWGLFLGPPEFGKLPYGSWSRILLSRPGKLLKSFAAESEQ